MTTKAVVVLFSVVAGSSDGGEGGGGGGGGGVASLTHHPVDQLLLGPSEAEEHVVEVLPFDLRLVDSHAVLDGCEGRVNALVLS